VRRRLLALAGVLVGVVTLGTADPAGAAETRLPLPPVGTFTEPTGLAVDQGSHDVYGIGGREERQKVTISATAGQFKLKTASAGPTKDLKFNAEGGEVALALEEIFCPSAGCLSVPSGQGNASGSNPYVVIFAGSLATTNIEELECVPGTTPLSGGSGCSVATTTNGINGSVSRYHANGTASEFSALGSNAIDGLAGPDETAQKGLHFNSAKLVQVAVDESGGETKGEIYVTQAFNHKVDIFGPGGEHLGELSEYEETPENEATLKPLGLVCGVAVDATGNVYLADASNGIHKYDPTGSLVSAKDTVANFTSVSQPCSLAAGRGPTEGFIFAVSFSGELVKLDAATGEGKYPISSGNTTVTVDPSSGHVLAAVASEVKEWDASKPSSATLLGSIAAGSSVTGVAVDGTTGKGGTVYVARSKVSHLDVYGPIVKVPTVETKEAGPIGANTATLNGTISADNGPEAHCHFQYIDATTYQAQKKLPEEASEPKTKAEITNAAFAGAENAACEPPGPFTGAAVNEISAAISGLSVETKYEFRLLGDNENGQVPGKELNFETLGKPLVQGGSASQIGATSALISGAVNPRGLDTSFAVEYVTEEQFEASGFEGATVTSGPAVPKLATGTGDLSAASGNGDLKSGSNVITNVVVSTGAFAIGQTISATAIPPETTITEVEPGRIELSNSASATEAAGALSAGSARVTNLTTTAGVFGPGETIAGPGIQPGTTIVTAKPGELVLSQIATQGVSGAELSASGFQPVSVELSGLAPDTAYVFRIVAESEAGAAQGKEGSFATFATLSEALPDHRAYEQVSPAVKLGEVYPPEPGPRPGLGGTCTACIPGWNKVKAPMQSTPDGSAVAYEGGPFAAGLAAGANSYVARRGAGGWQTSGLSTPQFSDFEGEGYKAFSTDLSRAVLYQAKPALSPEAPVDFANLYLREEGKAGLVPLITLANEAQKRLPTLEGPNHFKVDFAGANAGTESVQPFTHVVFQANDALTEAVPGIAPAAPEVKVDETDLYEWSGGELHLVNVLEGNEVAVPNAVIGSGLLLGVGGENYNFDHAISDDGNRVFWSEQPSGQVYVREAGTTTTEIPDPGKFITANPDGSKVLLSDGVLYDLESGTPTDLTGGQGGFQGMAGASEDLRRIYFVDTEELAPGGEKGEFNLYLWEEGAVSFIATLQEQDNKASGGQLGPWHAAPGNRLAQTTPDGRFLVFESRAPLTGYSNGFFFEVFEYDAQTQTLSCPSCNPSREAPLGPSNLSQIRSERGFFPQPQNLPPQGNGLFFFESRDTLTEGDQNGHIQDVYEWEPNGVGDCQRAKGCLALISSGKSPKDSHFVNASSSGGDVFFTTREQLVPQDKDGDMMDLYDARVGGGFAEEALAPCQGEACAGPMPSPPSFKAPASSGIEGEEAKPPPARCRRGFVRRTGKCTRRHRAHRHRRATHRKGAHR
jgi:hypothetical protein